jgi:hypothetical protein
VTGRSRLGGRRLAPVLLACAVTAALLALTACGSSSKPAYCSDRTSLENSVKGLKNVDLKNGLSGLQSQLNQIHTDATTLVSSAKSDFPTETSAVKTSVQNLTAAAKSLSTSPSVSQITKIASDAAAVSTAVKGFVDATSSKCS